MYDPHTLKWELVGPNCPPPCVNETMMTKLQTKTCIPGVNGEDEGECCQAGKCCCVKYWHLIQCSLVFPITTGISTTSTGTTTPGIISSVTTTSTGTTKTGIITTSTKTPGIITTPSSVVQCEELAKNGTKADCCTGESCDCPKGKFCCSEGGIIRVIGTKCCRGDGCCAMPKGREDCCHDENSCCATGCYKQCEVNFIRKPPDKIWGYWVRCGL